MLAKNKTKHNMANKTNKHIDNIIKGICIVACLEGHYKPTGERIATWCGGFFFQQFGLSIPLNKSISTQYNELLEIYGSIQYRRAKDAILEEVWEMIAKSLHKLCPIQSSNSFIVATWIKGVLVCLANAVDLSLDTFTCEEIGNKIV